MTGGGDATAADDGEPAVTERGAARRAGEQRFRLLADALPQIVWITDAEGRAEFFNRQWTLYTGAAYEPATAAEVAASFVHPDDAAATVAAFDEARRTGTPFSVEHRIRSAAGEYRWFLVRAEPHRDAASGEVVQWFGASVDIDERKRIEAERERLLQEVRVARTRLEEVFRRAPSFAVAYRGPNHVYEFVNEAYYGLIGRREVLGRALDEAVPESREQGFTGLLDRVLETGEPWVGHESPVWLERTPGAPRELRYVDMVFQPLTEVDGTRSGVLAHGFDITEQVLARREVERLLAESEQARTAADLARGRLEALLEHLPVGVTLAEAPSGRLLVSNAAVRHIWGLDTPAAQVAEYSALYVGFRPGPGPEADRRYASDEWPLARTLASGRPVADELIEILRPDGTRVMASVSAAPVRDAAGTVVGGIVMTQDVTEREQLLAAERDARTEAEAANRAKSEFLAVMSHELRTPLNAIGGYAELIELGIHGPVTDAQRTALERIQRSQRHLLGLIAGVLDYSRVEAGAVSYRLTDVPLAEAVAEAEVLVAPQLRAKGLGYAWSGAAPGLTVRADREKLQQVLLNLLGNAVKFTHARDGVPGRIEVACGLDEATGRVRIHVRDTGEGIDVAQLERVFEPFVQADQRLTRAHAGVGLGLAISRDLARGMGGELTAESVPGVGSTFTLTLPVGRVPPAGSR